MHKTSQKLVRAIVNGKQWGKMTQCNVTRAYKTEGEYDTGYYQKNMTGPRLKQKNAKQKTEQGYDRFDKLRKKESMSEEEYEEFTSFSREQLIDQHKSSDDAIPYEDVQEVDKKIANPPPNFKPVTSFSEIQLHPFLKQTLEDLKLHTPTPIQQMTLGLKSNDVIATSETGSGKTFAFLMPIVQSLFENNVRTKRNTVPMPIRALIVQPTRELCNQVYREALKLTLGSNIRVNMAFGSVSVRAQERQILRGTDILIATPGRLNHFLENGVLSVRDIDHLILDEADQLMDMGFIPQLRPLLHPMVNINKKRTTQMYSATFDKEIRKFANEFLKSDHAGISIGRVGQTTKNVTQNFELFEGSFYDKVQSLVYAIKRNPGKTLVFCRTKKTCENLVSLMDSMEMELFFLHGNVSQAQRQRSINIFGKPTKPNQKQKVLVATDLVARGIDIRDIAHVINFDLPDSYDKYVHRIGRTGRMGDKGTATTLVNLGTIERQDMITLQEIRKDFVSQEIPVPENLKSATNIQPRNLSISRRYGGRMDRARDQYERGNRQQRQAFRNNMKDGSSYNEFTKARNSHHKPSGSGRPKHNIRERF